MKWEQANQLLSRMSKSFNSLLSIFLISDTLKLVSVLIFVYFIPLFIVIIGTPINLELKGQAWHLLPFWMFKSMINSVQNEEKELFKSVYSGLVIPLITAYSLKTQDNNSIPQKVQFFLTFLFCLLLLTILGNFLLHNFDFYYDSLKMRDNGQDYVKDHITKYEIQTLITMVNNYQRDSLTYIGLTVGINFQAKS